MDTEFTALILTALIAAGTIILVYFAWRARGRPPPAENRSDRVRVFVPINTIAGPGEILQDDAQDEIVYDGSVTVTPGNHEVVPIPVRAGQRVRGVLKEVDGYTFNAYIMDSTGYSGYTKGRLPRCKWKCQDVASTTLDFVAGDDRSYLLVLELYGKQLARTISVRLRRTTRD